jgi:hypothetical protein
MAILVGFSWEEAFEGCVSKACERTKILGAAGSSQLEFLQHRKRGTSYLPAEWKNHDKQRKFWGSYEHNTVDVHIMMFFICVCDDTFT